MFVVLVDLTFFAPIPQSKVSHQCVKALASRTTDGSFSTTLVISYDGQHHSAAQGDDRPSGHEDLQRRAAEKGKEAFIAVNDAAEAQGPSLGKGLRLTRALRDWMLENWPRFIVPSKSFMLDVEAHRAAERDAAAMVSIIEWVWGCGAQGKEAGAKTTEY